MQEDELDDIEAKYSPGDDGNFGLGVDSRDGGDADERGGGGSVKFEEDEDEEGWGGRASSKTAQGRARGVRLLELEMGA
jgi:hypothetical protein